MAKVKILVLKQNNILKNLLTTIIDWTEDEDTTDFVKMREFELDNNTGLIIFERSIAKNNITSLKNGILKNKYLNINPNEVINYNSLQNDRTSFLKTTREYPTDEKKLISPFNNNSIVYENWSNDIQLREFWINIDEKIQQEVSKIMPVNLYYMIDRVGNVLHFKEIEEIDVSIIHQNHTFITLGFEVFGGFIKDKYKGTIEVKSFDDLILKEFFSINERFKDFCLQDEDYNIKVEIYNISTGRCVFARNFIFIKEITTSLHVLSSSVLEIKNENGSVYKKIPLKTTGSKSSIKSKHSDVVNLQQYRKTYTYKMTEKENLEFIPFKVKSEAVSHLCKQITKMAESVEPGGYIYLADPYFLRTAGKVNLGDYIDIFNSSAAIEFRILCTYDIVEADLKKFITNNKNRLFNNVTIKSIYQKRKNSNGYMPVLDDNGNPETDSSGNPIIDRIDSFHDRWIACKNEEYGLTNSINNFEKGVSFFKSLKHYYTEAETLWNIDANNTDFIIKEFKLC